VPLASSIFLIDFFSRFFREEINICSTCKREAAHFRPDNQLETHAGAGARNALVVDPHHPLIALVLVNLRQCPRRRARRITSATTQSRRSLLKAAPRLLIFRGRAASGLRLLTAYNRAEHGNARNLQSHDVPPPPSSPPPSRTGEGPRRCGTTSIKSLNAKK